jgi:hypothetical protein
MILNGQLSVSLFDLIFGGILVNFQDFERIEFFLNFFREVFLKEVLLIFGDSILIEEVFKDVIGISWKVSLWNYIPFNWSERPEMYSGWS